MMEELEKVARRATASARREADRTANADRDLLAVKEAAARLEQPASRSGRTRPAWYTFAGVTAPRRRRSPCCSSSPEAAPTASALRPCRRRQAPRLRP